MIFVMIFWDVFLYDFLECFFGMIFCSLLVVTRLFGHFLGWIGPGVSICPIVTDQPNLVKVSGYSRGKSCFPRGHRLRPRCFYTPFEDCAYDNLQGRSFLQIHEDRSFATYRETCYNHNDMKKM